MRAHSSDSSPEWTVSVFCRRTSRRSYGRSAVPTQSMRLAFIGWRKPGSLAPRTKIRFVIAIAFSLLVLAGWGALFYFLITEENLFKVGLEGTQ